MHSFPERPNLIALGDYRYRLHDDYEYHWKHNGQKRQLLIEQGFETDLASTPKLVWLLIGKQDLGLGPPLFHDALYRSGGHLEGGHIGYSRKLRHVDGSVQAEAWITTDPWTREQADRLFCRQMREIDVAMWKRRSSYYAVRVFGCLAWGSLQTPTS